MLSHAAPFPHPGSLCVPLGQPGAAHRIVQANRDGTLTISQAGADRGASATRRVPADRVEPAQLRDCRQVRLTVEEALDFALAEKRALAADPRRTRSTGVHLALRRLDAVCRAHGMAAGENALRWAARVACPSAFAGAA